MQRVFDVESNPFKNSSFFVPKDNRTTRPGIIFLHGAEGGGAPFWKGTAQFWAAHGYPSLAYCYFGRSDSLWGPRETLANFEIMELYEAMTWLKNSPYLNGGKVVIAGSSRGAELAMLFASLLAADEQLLQPDAVAVHCPSDETYGSWNLDWEDDRCWLRKIPENPPRGQHPGAESEWNPRCGQDPRYLPEDMKAAWKWKGQTIPAKTRIRAEDLTVPVFISHGIADDVWSVEKTRKIEQAMKNAGRSPEIHYFENQGHGLTGDAASRRIDLMYDFLKRTVG
jgi:dipeptidyl aminopeptidase/acylaminoacyl peptidase